MSDHIQNGCTPHHGLYNHSNNSHRNNSINRNKKRKKNGVINNNNNNNNDKGKRNFETKTAVTVDDTEDQDVDEELFLDWTAREVRLFAKRFLKGFGKAAAVYTGFRSISAVVRNPSRKGLSTLWREVFSRDCLRFSSFLGLYSSVYHLALALLKRYRKDQGGWNYGLAGGVAGLLSMPVEAASRHRTLALFAAARALGAGAGTAVSRGHVTPVPHAWTWSFCACCSVLVTCVALHPQLLPAGYYRSVLSMSRDYSDAALTKLFRAPGDRYLTCSEGGVHDGGCLRHALEDLVRSLPGFAKLYLPIHLVPALLFKRSKLRSRPKQAAVSLARNLIYSTLFVSTMVFLAKATICLLRRANGRPPPLPLHVPFVAGLVCGLSVLWERQDRRKQLVLFLIPQLLNAALELVNHPRCAPGLRVPQGHVMLFSAAMAVIAHAYEVEPASLSPLMAGVMRFVVGERDRRYRRGEGGGRARD